MIKKVLLLLVSLTILLAALPAGAESEAKAWTMALALIERETGVKPEQLQKYQIVHNDGVWTFSAILIDHPQDEDGLFIGSMKDDGATISLELPRKLSLSDQLQNDLKSCFNRKDCYLLLAAVRDKWQPMLAALSAQERDSIWERYAQVVELQLAIPPDNAMPYEDALRHSLEVMAAQPGWNEEKASLWRLCISAYYTPADIGRPVYFFYYDTHSYFEDGYGTDAAMARYEKKLKKAFDGEPPRQFSLMLDAMTGELVEEPICDYAPVKYHYLDFIIRPAQLLADMGK